MHSLESASIYLRELQFSDWKDIHQYASEMEVCQFQPWGPNSEEESMDYVEQALLDKNTNPRSRFVLAVIKKETNQLIGAGEFNIRDFLNQEGEIGYILHPGEWGKGRATEVASLLLKFGFETHGLHRIFATCHPENKASARVLEKNGLVLEGRLREHMLLKGGWRDSLLYSLLDYEWLELKSSLL